MSKERGLLNLCAVVFKARGICPLLLTEISELLAQPETEQEPVAWMYDHQIEVGYDKYTEVNIIETCARNLESNNCINIRPLYLAPPKLKRLTSEEINDGLSGKNGIENWYDDRFVDGVIFAEKHHGIGGVEC